MKWKILRKLVLSSGKWQNCEKSCHDDMFQATCQIWRMCNSLNITRKVRVTDRFSESLLVFLWVTRWGWRNNWEWSIYYKRQGVPCEVGAKAEKKSSTSDIQYNIATKWQNLDENSLDFSRKKTNKMYYGVRRKYNCYNWVTEWRLGQCERC